MTYHHSSISFQECMIPSVTTVLSAGAAVQCSHVLYEGPCEWRQMHFTSFYDFLGVKNKRSTWCVGTQSTIIRIIFARMTVWQDSLAHCCNPAGVPDSYNKTCCMTNIAIFSLDSDSTWRLKLTSFNSSATAQWSMGALITKKWVYHSTSAQTSTLRLITSIWLHHPCL